ncbi:hypothetical protein L208DRAFT_877524 [Tricholoma matsutake]|nr:hypothetical protein L208DRAFT_877524 [Tricholoma matsutake 945]
MMIDSEYYEYQFYNTARGSHGIPPPKSEQALKLQGPLLNLRSMQSSIRAQRYRCRPGSDLFRLYLRLLLVCETLFHPDGVLVISAKITAQTSFKLHLTFILRNHLWCASLIAGYVSFSESASMGCSGLRLQVHFATTSKSSRHGLVGTPRGAYAHSVCHHFSK